MELIVLIACTNSCEEPKKFICDEYAKVAVLQNKKNIEQECGYKDIQWTSDHSDHCNWCMQWNNVRIAYSHNEIREDDLNRCIAEKLSDPESEKPAINFIFDYCTPGSKIPYKETVYTIKNMHHNKNIEVEARVPYKQGPGYPYKPYSEKKFTLSGGQNLEFKAGNQSCEDGDQIWKVHSAKYVP